MRNTSQTPRAEPFRAILQLRKRTTDDTLVELAYTPLGPVLHVPPSEPRSDWANDFGTPWWKDRSLWIAKLSQKQRQINVVNTLTNQEDLLEVRVWPSPPKMGMLCFLSLGCACVLCSADLISVRCERCVRRSQWRRSWSGI